ncbi:MAG TPA: hypothetical protein VF913_22260 [Xanthobacteraceae bacterium]
MSLPQRKFDAEMDSGRFTKAQVRDARAVRAMLAGGDPPVEKIQKREESKMITEDERAEFHKRQAANILKGARQVERPDYCFSNFGDRVDKVALTQAAADYVDIDRRERGLAKGAAASQSDPPYTSTPTIPDKPGVSLPRGGADAGKPLNTGADWPVQAGKVNYHDLNEASAAHRAEMEWKRKRGYL